MYIKEIIMESVFEEFNEVQFDIMAFNGIPDKYEIIPIPARQGKDINNLNNITGAADSNNSVGCIWSNNTITNLLPAGETYSMGCSINNMNQVAGYIIPVATYKSKGFLYDNGIYTYLPDLGASVSPTSINNFKEITGKYVDIKGYNRGFYYNNGVSVDIGTLGGNSTTAMSINNKSQIVGGSSLSGSSYSSCAFIYGGGLMKNIGTLGGINSQANDINDNGWIVGNSDTGLFFSSHAFVYTSGKMYDLGTLNGKNSVAYSINNSNVIVGMSEKISQVIQTGTLNIGTGLTSTGIGGTTVLYNTVFTGFVWANGYMVDLNERINKKSGWYITQANAINDNGWIVGLGRSTDNSIKVLILKPIMNIS